MRRADHFLLALPSLQAMAEQPSPAPAPAPAPSAAPSAAPAPAPATAEPDASPAMPPPAKPPPAASAGARRPQSAGGGGVQRTRALAQLAPGADSASSFRTPTRRPASADHDSRSAGADAGRARAAGERSGRPASAAPSARSISFRSPAIPSRSPAEVIASQRVFPGGGIRANQVRLP